jgi:hypothetical protein
VGETPPPELRQKSAIPRSTNRSNTEESARRPQPPGFEQRNTRKEDGMATKVYGASDDLVEIEGDIRQEQCCFGTDGMDHGVLLAFSDGTFLEAKYGKGDRGIWAIALLRRGTLFDRIDSCFDEFANPHSDVAHFRDGLEWGYAATEWSAL